MTDSSLDLDVNRLWALLFPLVLDGEKRVAAMLSAHDLTTPQFYVIKTLTEQNGRCAIGQIAQMHGLTNATMTGIISRLELLGLVKRETNIADRRSVYVVLTESGVERFNDVQADFMDQLRVLLGIIPADERRRLLDELSRYVALIIGSS
jgi:DNA-binding MarR family transcriptional regulator